MPGFSETQEILIIVHYKFIENSAFILEQRVLSRASFRCCSLVIGFEDRESGQRLDRFMCGLL